MKISIDASNSGNELKLMAKQDKQIMGYAKFTGIKCPNGKAVLIQKFIYKNHQTATELIKEGLMRSWELGYAAAFTNNHTELFKELGFCTINGNVKIISQNDTSLLGYALTWNGLNLFITQTLKCKL